VTSLRRQIEQLARRVRAIEQRVANMPVRPSLSRGQSRWAMIRIDGATATSLTDGKSNPVRWTYSATEVEKTAAGYGGWSDKPGGFSGTAYHGIEEANDGSGTEATGADHDATLYTDSGFAMTPIQTGAVVPAWLVYAGGATEAWIVGLIGEWGTCSSGSG
jgi:hypothetical protein